MIMYTLTTTTKKNLSQPGPKNFLKLVKCRIKRKIKSTYKVQKVRQKR